MNDTAREALSAMLFADTSTPLDDVVRRCRANPVHLDDGQADALCSAAGPLVLWPEQGGFALLAADLHALVRDASLPDSGLILHLPATIRGMPLVRIAADAFRPWLSYGVGLRALIVPEGVEEISDGSLSPLCFECAALPSTLARFGLRMVRWSKLTRYPDAVEYLVDPGSATLFAEDGSLYSHDGETLIAHAYPYGERIEIRQGVRRIREDAFLHTPHPPRRIVCPDSLEAAPDGIDPALLWVADPSTDFARTLRADGRRCVSAAYRIIDGAVFDFDDDGAVLVATADDARSVDIPDGIGTAPVVRIGRRALPSSVHSVIVGSNVRTIEDGNACSGACRIVLADTLEAVGGGCFVHAALQSPVRIPRSVLSIGERSFEGSRIFIESLTTTVFVFSGARAIFTPRAYREQSDGTYEQTDAATDGSFSAPFDMRAYDELLAGDRPFQAKTESIVDRLAGKVAIDSETLESFAGQLGKNADAACTLVADRRSVRAVSRLADAGFYDNDERFFAQCERLRKMHAAQALGMLVRMREQARNTVEKPSARFAF